MDRELRKDKLKKQREAGAPKTGPKLERSVMDSLSSSDDNEADLSGDD